MPDLIALHREYEERMLEGGAFDAIEAEIDGRNDLDQVEIVHDHIEATKRANGRPGSLDLVLERRIRWALGLRRAPGD